MDLSICIVSWNARDLLRECLRSIASARSGLESEVLVVDNASADGSAELVQAEYPDAGLIRNERNRGFAAACNQAMLKARGRYLLLLNPDTVVHPGAFKEMVGFMDKHPTAGCAGCRVLNPDGTLQPSVRRFPTPRSSLNRFTVLGAMGFFRRSGREYLMKTFDYGREARVDQPIGAALFLRKAAVEKVGGMDEDFFLYFEEVDLCRRLRAAGYEIWYNPRAAVTHYGGRSTSQMEGEATFWLMKSQMLYFQKGMEHGPYLRFRALFKPLFLLGVVWGIVRNSISLGFKLASGAPRSRIDRTRNRLRRKWLFLVKYLPKFWTEV